MTRILYLSVFLLFHLIGYTQELKQATTIQHALADTSLFVVPEITTQQVKQVIAKSSALLLDTRPYDEWASGHLPGAINVSPKPGMPISLYTSDVHEILRIVKGDKSKALVLYCNGPFCGKSKRVSADLVKEGFTNVVRFQAGTPVWRAAGNVLQVEKEGLAYFSKDRTAVWVDAREEAAYRKETIKGAVNIPFNRMTGIKDSGEIKNAKDDGRLPMHDHNTRIVVIGDNLQQTTAVSEAITKEAFHNVYYFNGSFREARTILKKQGF